MNQQETYRLTYANLRWLLALLPAVLFITTVGTAIVQGHLEGSISAYYGGPVRDVFVGVLIAEAALLVAYQGATLAEDYNFNGAGFYAVFVALIPTGLTDNLEALRAGLELSPEGVTPAQYIWSLRISLTVVVLLSAWLLMRELRRRRQLRDLLRGDWWAIAFIVVTFGTLVGVQGLAMWQLWAPPAAEVTMGGLSSVPLLNQIPYLGQLRIHDLSAIFFMCALALGVAAHAWPQWAARNREALPHTATEDLSVYRVIFILMALGPLLAWLVAALFLPGTMVILLEWWEIFLFCLFWVMETRRQERLGRTLKRDDLSDRPYARGEVDPHPTPTVDRPAQS